MLKKSNHWMSAADEADAAWKCSSAACRWVAVFARQPSISRCSFIYVTAKENSFFYQEKSIVNVIINCKEMTLRTARAFLSEYAVD